LERFECDRKVTHTILEKIATLAQFLSVVLLKQIYSAAVGSTSRVCEYGGDTDH
jgi:hypothetical protein